MADVPFTQRLVAILAADVSGYSRLMSADERATIIALDSARAVFRREIEANGGRVVDMAGDSIMATFEATVGAVRAALAVQHELESSATSGLQGSVMRFRIGVHLGDIIEKPDGTIYGDGVNLAARLQGLANPGGIAVSESVRVAVKGKVQSGFEDLGQQAVKNIAEPIHAYRLNPLSELPSAKEPSAPDSGVDHSRTNRRWRFLRSLT